MAATILWIVALVSVGLLLNRDTRSAGLMSLAGTALDLLFHYDIGTISEVHTLSMLLWLSAAFLIVVKTFAGRRRRSA